MENTSLGSLIKNARLAKGYSQKHLSNLCEVSQKQISNIEAGKSTPHLSTLKSICSALDIDFNDTLKKFGYIQVESSSEETVNLSDFIKNARLSKGYSQRDLSNLCEVSQEQISKIEIGQSIPSLFTLKSICSALDIDFNETLKKFGYIKVENSSKEAVKLGDFIKNTRLAKEYSQVVLSNLSKVSKNQIGNIEAGKSTPHLSTLKLICSALDIDFDKALELRAKNL